MALKTEHKILWRECCNTQLADSSSCSIHFFPQEVLSISRFANTIRVDHLSGTTKYIHEILHILKIVLQCEKFNR